MRTLIRLCLLLIAAFICSIIFSIPQHAFAQANCTICITEFRTRGPGTLVTPPTAGSADDEFVEIYNNTDSDINIGGYKLRATNNTGTGNTTPRSTVPANTMLPARTHYLFTSSFTSTNGTYSLGAVAASDRTYGTGIADDGSIAFTDAADVPFDQVGMNNAATSYKEGTILASIAGASAAGATNQFSYVRKINTATNHPQDTGDNATDFVLVVADTAANLTSKYGSQKMVLGAPGPENLASPIESDAKFTGVLYDNTVTASQPPNRCYDQFAGGGSVGSLFIRRNVTNNSAPTNQLRLRVVDITTATNPATTGKAILKPMTSTGNGSTNCPIPNGFPIPQATSLDAPSVTDNGGLNSTLSTTPITVSTTQPLEYRLAADRTGTFTFLFIYEAK
jgi:hypothetical protein